MLPARYSRKWFLLFIIYAAVIFAVFYLTKRYLGVAAANRRAGGVLVLAILTSMIPCIGGYMGKRIFFTLFSVSVVVGLAYALYAVFADIAPGWAELTSIIGYMFIVGIGFIVAANAELISYFLRNRKK